MRDLKYVDRVGAVLFGFGGGMMLALVMVSAITTSPLEIGSASGTVMGLMLALSMVGVIGGALRGASRMLRDVRSQDPREIPAKLQAKFKAYRAFNVAALIAGLILGIVLIAVGVGFMYDSAHHTVPHLNISLGTLSIILGTGMLCAGLLELWNIKQGGDIFSRALRGELV